MLLWAGVALFIACIGKSGQFPLHTWLPDAMAGPTPVSSLLHSSTMVVAGVFLVARLYPVFWEAFDIPDVSVNLIVVIAAITIVISALLAFVQNDIKKVLAYSTVGQLGYMMLGLGAGAWLPAVFHIFTHAFFKCALFLCAGSVSHSGSHHSFDMKQDMGGLAKKMPITATCWIIAGLALAGVFPLAGFFSKDEIIDNVGHNGYEVFMWIALVGAFLTAAYTVRATYLTFFGVPRGAAAIGTEHEGEHLGDELSSHDLRHDIQQEGELEVDHHAGAVAVADHHDGHGGHDDHGDAHHGAGPHESPKLILIPICILAFFAIVAGFTNATRVRRGVGELQGVRRAAPRGRRPDVAGARPTGRRGAAPAADGGDGGRRGRGRARRPRRRAAASRRPRPARRASSRPSATPSSSGPRRPLSLAIVAAGLVSSWFVCVALYTSRNRRLVGLTERFAAAARRLRCSSPTSTTSTTSTRTSSSAPSPTRSPGPPTGSTSTSSTASSTAPGGPGGWSAAWLYRNIDQRVVDGAVNGSGRRRQRHRLGAAARPVRQGQPVRCAALRRRRRRRRRARDRQRVRLLRSAWTSSPIRTGC